MFKTNKRELGFINPSCLQSAEKIVKYFRWCLSVLGRLSPERWLFRKASLALDANCQAFRIVCNRSILAVSLALRSEAYLSMLYMYMLCNKKQLIETVERKELFPEVFTRYLSYI